MNRTELGAAMAVTNIEESLETLNNTLPQVWDKEYKGVILRDLKRSLAFMQAMVQSLEEES